MLYLLKLAHRANSNIGLEKTLKKLLNLRDKTKEPRLIPHIFVIAFCQHLTDGLLCETFTNFVLKSLGSVLDEERLAEVEH